MFAGLTFYNHMPNTVKSETHSKPSMKPAFSRGSTLMKPTVSQLAKQNHPFQAAYSRWLFILTSIYILSSHDNLYKIFLFFSRSNIPVSKKAPNSSATGCVIENQAAKRQKLDGGLLRKVSIFIFLPLIFEVYLSTVICSLSFACVVFLYKCLLAGPFKWPVW